MHAKMVDYYGVTPQNLAREERSEIWHWRNQVKEPTPRTKYGLWLFGERGAGTTYAAKTVFGYLAFQAGFVGAQHVTAVSLMEMQRSVWTAQEQMRHHADDTGLFNEARDIQDGFDMLLKVCDLLWIDDFHDETIDMKFWKRHIQPWVEERVKEKRPTIVSTSLTPDDGAIPTKVIENLFVTVHCEGFRPDIDSYPYDDAGR